MSSEYVTASEAGPSGWVDGDEEESLGGRMSTTEMRRKEALGVRRGLRRVELDGEGSEESGDVGTNQKSWCGPRGRRVKKREVEVERIYGDIPATYTELEPSGQTSFSSMSEVISLRDVEYAMAVDGAGSERGAMEKPAGMANRIPGHLRHSSVGDAQVSVQRHISKHGRSHSIMGFGAALPYSSRDVTPCGEQTNDGYRPRPQQFRGGILSSLLMLYQTDCGQRGIGTGDDGLEQNPSSVGRSPAQDPRAILRVRREKWLCPWKDSYELLPTFNRAIGTQSPGRAKGLKRPPMSEKKKGKQKYAPDLPHASIPQNDGSPERNDMTRLQIHLRDILCRQEYIRKLCRALINYGAPMHRLEEYMRMTARSLEIDGHFLYLPGCMIIAFDDALSHTTEVKLVRAAPGIDLGKLKDIHQIYKEILHEVVDIKEAIERLDIVINQPPEYNDWWRVLAYGVAIATVGPFAFGATWFDLPPILALGLCFGILHLHITPLNPLFTNISEVATAILFLFLSRALGSLRHGTLFCFSALAQSSICFIIPGYMIVCAALELQARAIVPGAIRIVYAFVYSMFLGFGMTIGIALYGLFDHNATTATTCPHSISPVYLKFLFVPPFTIALAVINQARLSQMPIMVVIAFLGFVVNFFTARVFPTAPEISNAMGAFVIGLAGNFYSRTRHGAQGVSVLPAILVQVPSGLMAAGGLLEGLEKVEEMVRGRGKLQPSAPSHLNVILVNVGYSMVEIAVGITVGLSMSSLVVYPLGKKKSGLFGF